MDVVRFATRSHFGVERLPPDLRSGCDFTREVSLNGEVPRRFYEVSRVNLNFECGAVVPWDFGYERLETLCSDNRRARVIGPERSRARVLCAAKRTLDG